MSYMVTIATITHKNQLTIPREFMESSNLVGTKKVLLEKKGNKILIKPLKSRVKELAGSLYDFKRKPFSRKKEREILQGLIAQEVKKEGL